MVEPYSSPTTGLRYDTITGQIASYTSGIQRTVAINRDGSRMVYVNAIGQRAEVLGATSSTLSLLSSEGLIEGFPISTAFNPAQRNLLYVAMEDGPLLEIDSGSPIHTSRLLKGSLPYNFYQALHALVVQDDGEWAYTFLIIPQLSKVQVNEGKVRGIRISRPDTTPPVTHMNALPTSFTTNWWHLYWSGEDSQSGIMRYDVQFRAGAGGTWRDWASTTYTSTLFRNAQAGQTYYFRVRGVDHSGNVEGWRAWDAMTVAGADASGLYQSYFPALSR
jgi:hypothetical protein